MIRPNSICFAASGMSSAVSSVVSTIVGALILVVLTTLLTALDMPEAAKQMLFGLIIVLVAAAYTRVTGES